MSGPWIMYTWVKVVHGYVQVMDHVAKEVCVSSQGWQQDSSAISGNVWALDNVYLGEGCLWLCSGHGSCNQGKCV